MEFTSFRQLYLETTLFSVIETTTYQLIHRDFGDWYFEHEMTTDWKLKYTTFHNKAWQFAKAQFGDFSNESFTVSGINSLCPSIKYLNKKCKCLNKVQHEEFPLELITLK